MLDGAEGPIIAATDYMKVVPDQLAPWLPGRLVTLGTDGFGRSDNRQHLRQSLRSQRGVDCRGGAVAPGARRQVRRRRGAEGFAELGVDTEKIDPAIA